MEKWKKNLSLRSQGEKSFLCIILIIRQKKSSSKDQKKRKKKRKKTGEHSVDRFEGKFESQSLLSLSLKAMGSIFDYESFIFDSTRLDALAIESPSPRAICPSRGRDNVSIRPPICRSSSARGWGGLSTLRYKPEPSRAAIRVSRVHARNNIILAPRRIIGISGQVCFCHALPRCHTLSINKRGRKGGGRKGEREEGLPQQPDGGDGAPSTVPRCCPVAGQWTGFNRGKIHISRYGDEKINRRACSRENILTIFFVYMLLIFLSYFFFFFLF